MGRVHIPAESIHTAGRVYRHFEKINTSPYNTLTFTVRFRVSNRVRVRVSFKVRDRVRVSV